MPLREEYERSGAWLFRWRSYFPLVLAVICVFAIYQLKDNQDTQYDHVWEIACFAVSFFGLAIRAKTIGHSAAKTSGRNTKTQVADSLNTTGMYSIVRNPLYLGNFFMVLGVVLYTRHVWAVLVFALVFYLYYERIIFAEEAFLRVKFGDEYINWANKTPALLPRWGGYAAPEKPFSLKLVLRREYNGFVAVICSLFIFELIRDWLAKGHISVDGYWVVIVAVGFVIWMTLRLLRKLTRLLN